MKIKFNSNSNIETRYGNLTFYEDDEQKCLHIWVKTDLEVIIKTDCNHIRIYNVSYNL